MTWAKLWVIALRDLGRNRRRTLLTMMAVMLGMAIMVVMNGFIAGVMDSALQNNIRLNTGHMQIRAASYAPEKLSLLWQDLLEGPQAYITRALEQPEVSSAAPVLWAGAILGTQRESFGVTLTGIDPQAGFHAPIQQGMVSGEYLTADVRNEILIGKRLADSMGISVGQRVSLAVGNPDGNPEEGIFTVRGVFVTGIPGYDEGTVFMPLSQAQAFTGSGDRVSTIVLMLADQAQAENVAAALQFPGVSVLTWQDLNAVWLQTIGAAMGFYIILYAIVILVVAVVIANTLLMAVFERTREMGILAALGMRRREIMVMFLFEAVIIGLFGIVLGILLGSAGVLYLSEIGLFVGDSTASLADGIAIGATLYARFVPSAIVSLAFWMLFIVVLVSLYPAWYAARMEPVKALRAV